MKIQDFFIQFSSISQYNYPVISFISKTYQPIFLKKLYAFMEDQLGQELKFISVDQDIVSLQAKLSTTFLGQKYWYVFDNVAALSSKKKRDEIISFINNYQGPHTIAAFIPEADNKKINSAGLTCHIDSFYSKDQIRSIKMLYEGQSSEAAAYFFNKLYRYKKEYSLDQLFFFKEYALLLGKNMNVFFDEWLDKLVVSDISLFVLSQLFFEKNATNFFQKWQKIRSNYVDQFWISFFSEQIFKAYFYLVHHGALPQDQKQISFGLPFSFLKHDFKMHSQGELMKVHQKLYEIDLSLKNSGSAAQLDALFLSFFQGTFL